MMYKFSTENLALLRETFSYEPETGLVRWRIHTKSRKGRIQPGDVAGTTSAGRIQIKFKGAFIRAHTLAHWFMTERPVPAGFMIDHKDRDQSNNRWDNLRLLDKSGNNHNANPCKKNTSGVRGVSLDSRGRWDARIHVRGKCIVLGQFSDKNDAIAARLAAEQKYLGEIMSTHLVTVRK